MPINSPRRSFVMGKRFRRRLRPWLIAAFCSIVVLLTGCVLFVDRVVSEPEALFDPGLLGTWRDVESSDVAVVSSAEGNAYLVEFTSQGSLTRFQGRLARLGTRQVMDLRPAPNSREVNAAYADLLLPAHLLITVALTGDTLWVAPLDRDSLVAAGRAGELGLTHTMAGEHAIVHGVTPQLRTALETYLERAGAFTRPSILRREQAAHTAARPPTFPCFDVSSWREADRLFRRDANWVGGDGTASVDLGDGRILWLFGDSWIDPSGQGTRRGARMVSNSVAIQHGNDPSSATIRFYWGRAANGEPAPFIADSGEERHWFGNGVLLGDRLVLFLQRVRSTNVGLGFESLGWAAWLVENPAAEPSGWRLRRLETPPDPLAVMLGVSAVMIRADSVYAFGTPAMITAHPLYAARWPGRSVRAGDLGGVEWWAGERLGWVADSLRTPRQPIFENAQVGLSLHADTRTQQFIAVQTVGFGAADIALRGAPTLTGPWSAPRVVFRPPEYYRPNSMIYSARAHPELAGADLVLTYDTNTFQFLEHLTDSSIYYPRFLRLAHCG